MRMLKECGSFNWSRASSPVMFSNRRWFLACAEKFSWRSVRLMEIPRKSIAKRARSFPITLRPNFRTPLAIIYFPYETRPIFTRWTEHLSKKREYSHIFFLQRNRNFCQRWHKILKIFFEIYFITFLFTWVKWNVTNGVNAKLDCWLGGEGF